MTRPKLITLTAITGVLAGFWLAGGVERLLSEAEVAYRAYVVAEQFKALYCQTAEGQRACGNTVRPRAAVVIKEI